MRSRALSVALVFASLTRQALADSVPRLDTRDEAELAATARLETVVRLALERNPELAESQARALAARSRESAASRLPDLELKYEQWGVSLARPASLARADTIMLGVRQTFPAWGSLDARARAAGEDAGRARDAERARRQEVAAQVYRAYAVYYRADRELSLHLEHVGLTAQVLALTRQKQKIARGGVLDVLRTQVELTRLHAEVPQIERDERSSRARLNSLMGRAPDAPLGPPEELSVAPDADLAGLDSRLDANRPEVGAAAHVVHGAEATLEETRRAARIPDLMVGLDYWYRPADSETRHAYGAMVAINLPWLSGRRRDQEREAEQALRAERHALDATRNAVRFELSDAAARLTAARQSFTIIDQELLAQERRSLEASQAAYASGQDDARGLLEALRSYLGVRIDRVRALAELATSSADLQRAAGTLATGDRP